MTVASRASMTWPTGGKHAAADDRRDPAAAHVQVDVAVIGAADAVEQPADLDDVVGRRSRRLPPDRRPRLGVRVGRAARGLGAEIDADVAARRRARRDASPHDQRPAVFGPGERGRADDVRRDRALLAAPQVERLHDGRGRRARGSRSRGTRRRCRRAARRDGAAAARRTSAASTLPSRSASRQSSNWPVRSLANTTESPSGQKLGSRSTNASSVSRRGSPRSASHNVAERRERRAPAVGRAREAVDAERRPRRRVVERREIGRRRRRPRRRRPRTDAPARASASRCRAARAGRRPRRRTRRRSATRRATRTDPRCRSATSSTRGSPSTQQLQPARLRRVLLAEDQHAAAGPPRRRRQAARARVHDVDRAVDRRARGSTTRRRARGRRRRARARRRSGYDAAPASSVSCVSTPPSSVIDQRQ